MLIVMFTEEGRHSSTESHDPIFHLPPSKGHEVFSAVQMWCLVCLNMMSPIEDMLAEVDFKKWGQSPASHPPPPSNSLALGPSHITNAFLKGGETSWSHQKVQPKRQSQSVVEHIRPFWKPDPQTTIWIFKDFCLFSLNDDDDIIFTRVGRLVRGIYRVMNSLIPQANKDKHARILAAHCTHFFV